MAGHCSPFGVYLLHTRLRQHGLRLTRMRPSTCCTSPCWTSAKAVDARPRYVLDEHMIPRYLAAVSAICLDTKTKRNDWTVMLHSTGSFFEFLSYKRFNEFSKDLKELLR